MLCYIFVMMNFIITNSILFCLRNLFNFIIKNKTLYNNITLYVKSTFFMQLIILQKGKLEMINWKESRFFYDPFRGIPVAVLLYSTVASQWPKSIFEREFALTIHGPLPMSSLNPLSHFTHRLITSPSPLKMIFQSRQKRKAYVKSLKWSWRMNS